MKRPRRVYRTTDGIELPYTMAQEYEADQELFRKVLEWRSIPRNGHKMCDRCGYSRGSRKRFVIHHRHYRTFGEEHPEDVCLLCITCHEDLHRRADKFLLTTKDIPFVDPTWEEMIRDLAAERPAISNIKPKCPICSSEMVKRWGSRGSFWGCPNFPSCRGTRNLHDVPVIGKADSLDGMCDEFPPPLTSERRWLRRQKYGHLFPFWRGTFCKGDKTWTETDRYADEEDARRNFEAQNDVLEWDADLVSVERVE